jgi:putative membrane protein
MIAREHAPLWKLWPWALRRLLGLLVFDITIALLYTEFHVRAVSIPDIPLGMMGGALSIFLAFRNSSAYERWWEARNLWGSLVNNARTFARQVLTLIDPLHPEVEQDELRRELVELQITYVHALRCHLRGQNPFPEMRPNAPPELVAWLRTQHNVPIAILQRMAERTRALYDLGRLDSIRFAAIDDTLTALCNVQGACERIKNTPLPRQYEYFPRLLVGMYTVLLPLGQVGNMGLWTPMASTVVSMIFLCLEVIGRDIEDPFESTVNDTPMSSLTRAIEINLRQGLRLGKVPREIRPVEGFVF